MPQNHSIGEEGVQLDIYKASQTIKSIDENTFLLELNKYWKKVPFQCQVSFQYCNDTFEYMSQFTLLGSNLTPPPIVYFLGLD